MPSSTGSPEISIVVPCYNEEDSVRPLYEALAFDFPVEIVFVDDGSTDGTLAELRSLAAADPRVRYTSFSRNFGKEAAMLAGLRHATGDAVVIIDADLQHPPHLLPQMITLWQQGFDQVVAVRDRRGESLMRRTSAGLFYRSINRLIDVRLDDGAGDFRLLSRRAVNAILSLPESNRFAKGLFSWIGFPTAVLPYRNEQRRNGTSKWSTGKLVNYAMDGLLSFNDKPLRLAVYGGLLATMVALGYSIWVVTNALMNGIDVPGYTTIIVAVIGMGGFQAILLGLIGEYVGRIYHESKRRPHYLIQESESTRNEPLNGRTVRVIRSDDTAPTTINPSADAR